MKLKISFREDMLYLKRLRDRITEDERIDLASRKKVSSNLSEIILIFNEAFQNDYESVEIIEDKQEEDL